MKKGFNFGFLAQSPNWHFKGCNLNAETYRCLGGIIFFSLSHVGAQSSLLPLLTGTLWWIPHRNFSTISAAPPALCSTLRVCKPLPLIVQMSVSSGRSTGEQTELENMSGESAWFTQTRQNAFYPPPFPDTDSRHSDQNKLYLLFNLFSLMSLHIWGHVTYNTK